MPRKVADLVKELPEMLKKVGRDEMSAKELREMGAKQLRALERELMKEEKEMEAVPVGAAKVKEMIAKHKAKKAMVSSEEAKVLEQTDSAFLPEAIAASTKKLVVPPPAAKDTRAKAEKALEEVGISVVKRGRKPKVESSATVAKKEVAKALKEAESDVKLLEAEKKGLLKSGAAKAKARELRFEKSKSKEGAEMAVKEGAAKAKWLLGKVKGEVVAKVRARKEKAVKAVPEGLMSPKRKASLRTHQVATETIVPPALGHPKAPAVPKAKHMHGAAVERELMRVGISV